MATLKQKIKNWVSDIVSTCFKKEFNAFLDKQAAQSSVTRDILINDILAKKENTAFFFLLQNLVDKTQYLKVHLTAKNQDDAVEKSAHIMEKTHYNPKDWKCISTSTLNIKSGEERFDTLFIANDSPIVSPEKKEDRVTEYQKESKDSYINTLLYAKDKFVKDEQGKKVIDDIISNVKKNYVRTK